MRVRLRIVWTSMLDFSVRTGLWPGKRWIVLYKPSSCLPEAIPHFSRCIHSRNIPVSGKSLILTLLAMKSKYRLDNFVHEHNKVSVLGLLLHMTFNSGNGNVDAIYLLSQSRS